jgi:hypothetical protein
MADAPERIWARPVGASRDWTGATSGPWSLEDPFKSATEYIRADLPPTPEQIASDPRVRALVEAARRVHDSYWYSTDGIIQGMYDLDRALAAFRAEGGE